MPKIVDHVSRRLEVARAVLAVVERDGVNAASVRAVAAECGWSYGMIAHYFKNRDDLLLFAYRLALSRELELGTAEDDGTSPLERLIGFLLRALPVDANSSLDVRIWLGFMGRVADDPTLARAVLKEHETYQNAALALVDECIEKGLVTSDLSADLLLQYVLVYVDGLGISATLDPDNFGTAALRPMLTTFLSTLGFHIG